MRIFINPGHGGTDPGAIGPGGRKESNDNLSFAYVLYRKLEDEGYQCKLFRNDDSYKALSQIVEESNAWSADLFISVHRNSDANNGINGSEVLVSRFASYESYRVGRKLNYTLGMYFNERPLKDTYDNTFVLDRTNCPAVTLELGFITSPVDNNILDVKYMQIASAITDDIKALYPDGATQAPALDRLYKIENATVELMSYYEGDTQCTVRFNDGTVADVPWEVLTRG